MTVDESWGDFIQNESLLTKCGDMKVGLADEGALGSTLSTPGTVGFGSQGAEWWAVSVVGK